MNWSEIAGVAISVAAVVGPIVLRTHGKVKAVLLTLEKVLEALTQPPQEK